MRVMLVLLVLAVVGAGVAVVLGERDDGGSFYGWRPHAPESADEQAAARVAVAYALAIVKGDSARACTYAAGESFRRLRCATRPRRDRYLSASGEVRAYHVALDGGQASVWLDGIEPGPVRAFELRRVGKRWRVIADEGFGLA
jgi:hypothetical protein